MSEGEATAPPSIGLRRISSTETHLQDVFQELDVDNNGNSHTTNGDAVRPQKRRRLYSGTMSPSSIANYDDLVRSISQLFSSQNPTDLDGLHLIAT